MTWARRIAGLQCPECRAVAPVGIFQTLRWRGVHPPTRLSVECAGCGAVLRLKQKSAGRLGWVILFLIVQMSVVFAASVALVQFAVFVTVSEQGTHQLNVWGSLILMAVFIVSALQIYRIYNVEEVPS